MAMIEGVFNELTETVAQDGPEQNSMWALDTIMEWHQIANGQHGQALEMETMLLFKTSEAYSLQGKGEITLAFSHSPQPHWVLEDKQVDETEPEKMNALRPQPF
ncbi:unnamed protein product, partial [Prorocentrum cordatum]